jgi:hypothetical protein
MMDKDLAKLLAKLGAQGGKKAAGRMTKAERTARARKAGKARQAKARKERGL